MAMSLKKVSGFAAKIRDEFIILVTRPLEKREESAGEAPAAEVTCWLTPVGASGEESAEEVIEDLVGKEGIFVFGERTPGRRQLKPGDLICFYAAGKGVVADARVASRPEEKVHPRVRESERYRWVFDLDDCHLYPDKPVIIDAGRRRQLDVFKGRDPGKPWGWLVQTTRRLSSHDFQILTRREG